MARAVSLTYAFSCLLAVVAAKKKAEPAPTPEPLMSTEINFLVVAVACLVGAAAAKQMGIAPATVALGAAFAFAMLEAADLMLVKPYLGLSAFYPGHAPVTCILFAMPSKPATATAYGVLGGHVAATLSALAQVDFMPEALAFATKVITVGLAVGAMKVGDAVHPPACAFALAFVGGSKGPMFAAGPLIGCAILIASQRIWLALPAPASAAKKKN